MSEAARPIGAVPRITGATALVPLIGHPVVQVKSPPVLNAHWAEQKIDAVMAPLDIPPELVALFFELVRRSPTIAGVSATVPHKQAAFAAADTKTPRARATGAVNSIRRDDDGSLHGDNTDGLACVASLARAGFDAAGKRCLVVGAGGAGGAIAHALADAGAAAIAIHDLDARRAQVLARSVAERRPSVEVATGLAALATANAAVNASTAGMRSDDPLAFDPSLLPPHAVVADVVTTAEITPLLARARAHGLAIRTGAQMAAEQTHLQTEWFAMVRYQR